jgi:arylsulfatase A-like enzyme
MDSLGASGVVWENARTVFSITQPSHASMMTGRYPSHIGTVSNSSTLQAHFNPIALELSMKGYRCGAFINTWILNEESGLNHGFETFVRAERETLTTPRIVEKEGKLFTTNRVNNPSAARTVNLANSWMAETEKPFFLWVHLMDPHLDYTPPDSILSYLGFTDIDPKYGNRAFLSGRHKRGLSFSMSAVTKMKRLYAGEVAFVDRALARLFSAVRDKHRNTVIVLVSDHGENICDDGSYVGHAYSLDESVVRIPLLISGPGIPMGIRIPTPVDLTQLKPTLRGILDLESVGSEKTDLFSKEERVLICRDLKGRTAGYYRGWHTMRDTDGNQNRITHTGLGDSLNVIARIDSALYELDTSSIEEYKRSLNANETSKLSALGYAE